MNQFCFIYFRSSNHLRMNTTGDTTMQDDSDEQQEVIEVQILPQVSLLKIERDHFTFVIELSHLLTKYVDLVVIDQHQYLYYYQP